MPVPRVIFHVDIDAFFASVEQLDNPRYAGLPVIVGALPGRRGVVSTCSYEARMFGVHSAMPISEAARRCPDGIFLPVRMKRYHELSRKIIDLYSEFTPEVTVVSIDEAFLDMSGTERIFGPPFEAGRVLKEKVRGFTGLTISVGIAPNRYLAKIASASSKPDGLCMVEKGGEEKFLDGIPIERLWGAGDKTQDRFKELNIRTTAQLRSFPEASLKSLFGKAFGSFLYGAVRGVDLGIFEGEAKSKSISTETTFERDVRDEETLESVLLGMAHQLMFSLLEKEGSARTVVLKLRSGEFVTTTSRESRSRPFASAEELYDTARRLLSEKWSGFPVRLIGLGIAGVSREEGPRQGELFEDSSAKKGKVEKTILELERRGKGRVVKARLLGRAERKRPEEDSGPSEP